MNDIMKMYLRAFNKKNNNIIKIKESIVSVPREDIMMNLNLNELRDVIVSRAVRNYLNNKD